VEADARHFIATPPRQAFDLVFLDPPFGTELIAEVLPLLDSTWLTPSALVYVECARVGAEIALPNGWRIMRVGETRQTRYCLVSVGA